MPRTFEPTEICTLKKLKLIFTFTQFVEYFTTITHCYLYATEEIQAFRECTTSDILSFILQDKLLGLSNTRVQVFQESFFFSLQSLGLE